MQLELFLVPQRFEVFKILDPNARTANFGISQDHLVHLPKVRCLRCPMLDSDFIHLDSVPEIDFVEADVRRLVLTGGGNGHGEQGALRHGRHRVGCYIALRPRTNCPCARRIVLFEQIADAIPIGDCQSFVSRCQVHLRIGRAYKSWLRRRC